MTTCQGCIAAVRFDEKAVFSFCAAAVRVGCVAPQTFVNHARSFGNVSRLVFVAVHTANQALNSDCAL